MKLVFCFVFFFVFVLFFNQGYHGLPMLHIHAVKNRLGNNITSPSDMYHLRRLLYCSLNVWIPTTTSSHEEKPTILATEEYITMLFLNMSYKAAEKSRDCRMVSACDSPCLMDAERN